MIQWNNGEPPKDGRAYLATMEYIRTNNGGNTYKNNYADLVYWSGYHNRFVSCTRPHCSCIYIITWSEINLPEDQP